MLNNYPKCEYRVFLMTKKKPKRCCSQTNTEKTECTFQPLLVLGFGLGKQKSFFLRNSLLNLLHFDDLILFLFFSL